MTETFHEVELQEVWWSDASYTVGTSARRITLVADGHGLSGYYDRIHVYRDDGRHIVFPAHHADGWVLKETATEEEGYGF